MLEVIKSSGQPFPGFYYDIADALAKSKEKADYDLTNAECTNIPL
jgi:hypothetical protein